MSTTPGYAALASAMQRSTFGDMTARRKAATPHVPMNALSRLIHRRKDELELSWYDIGDRGGFSSHTIVYALAKKAEHRQVPRAETLTRLARALDLPLDVVKVAAAEAAGFELTEVSTTLETAEDVRIIAGVMADLSPRDRAKLRRIAIAMKDEAVQDSESGETDSDGLTAEQVAVRAELSEQAHKVSAIRAKRKK